MTFPNHNTEAVQPVNLQVTPQNKRTVYFIQYRLVDEDGKMGTPVMGNDGRVYRMPPLGEHLVLPERVAVFIANRLRVWDQNAQVWIEAFTDSASVAKAVKESYLRGDLDPQRSASGQHFKDIMTRQALNELSLEDLEIELARRQAEIDEKAQSDENAKKAKKKT